MFSKFLMRGCMGMRRGKCTSFGISLNVSAHGQNLIPSFDFSLAFPLQSLAFERNFSAFPWHLLEFSRVCSYLHVNLFKNFLCICLQSLAFARNCPHLFLQLIETVPSFDQVNTPSYQHCSSFFNSTRIANNSLEINLFR